MCQSHGFPKIMGVLTHLDVFKNNKKLKKRKKTLKQRSEEPMTWKREQLLF